VSASFSFDSAYFCTCDLSGGVKVWKSSSNELVTSFETGDLAVSFIILLEIIMVNVNSTYL